VRPSLVVTFFAKTAVVAQLAKPTAPQSQYWQITSTFKFQVLTWIGIIGSSIMFCANFNGVLDLADWARELVARWLEWIRWFGDGCLVQIPKEFAPSRAAASHWLARVTADKSCPRRQR